MKYLLPCSCGEQAEIDIGQAGQTIACQGCGNSLEVPTLRGIRQLKPAAAEPTDADDRRQGWSRSQGALFAVGLGMLLLAVIGGTFLLIVRAQLVTTKPAIMDNAHFEQEVARFEEELAKMPVDIVYDMWQNEIEQSGIGTWQEPGYVSNRVIANTLTVMIYVAIALAVCGLGAAIVSLSAKPGTNDVDASYRFRNT